MKTRKTPYTTADLFKLVWDDLKASGKNLSFVEYADGPREPHKLRDYSFDVFGVINYGGSEGIYVDLFYKGDIGYDAVGNYDLGTIKTLETDDDTFRVMALLMADFQIKATRFINANLDDFTWTGHDIDFFEDGKTEKSYGVTLKGNRSARELTAYAERIMRHNPQYEYAVVTFNATGHQWTVPGPNTRILCVKERRDE